MSYACACKTCYELHDPLLWPFPMSCSSKPACPIGGLLHVHWSSCALATVHFNKVHMQP